MLKTVNRGNNDMLYVYLLIVQFFVGWMISNTNQGKFYLMIGSLVLMVSFTIYITKNSIWYKTQKYHRFILIISFVSYTFFLQVEFANALISILHVCVVLIISAFFFIPLFIWFTALCYLIFYAQYLLERDQFLFHFSTIWTGLLLLFIIAALHYICRKYDLKMKEVRKQEQELSFRSIEKQQHLATIGQIATSIAHDIRNPLTSIQGFIQLIQGGERGANFQLYLQIIRSEITRIDTLLREVLLLSKSHTEDTETWELVLLDVLLERIVILMNPDAIKNNIQIVLTILQRPVVMGSEEKLQQVFMNLLRNSLEAIDNNGRVDIILSQEEGEAMIRFRDSGDGIPEEKIEQLFIPFFTTKSEGTGLGLSICQSIIKAYDGDIKVRNIPMQGAEFLVTLPI